MLAARRVIEIDDVLVASNASALSVWHSSVKICRLTPSSSAADSMIRSQSARSFQAVHAGDVFERRLAGVLGDAVGFHLPGHVAVDGGKPGLDTLLGDVAQLNVIARECAHMGDTVAHLAGADDAYFTNFHRSAFTPGSGVTSCGQ